MRRAIAFFVLLLAIGCAPDIDRRTRCESNAQCFRDEACQGGQCRPKGGPAGPGGPGVPDASSAKDAVDTSDTDGGIALDIVLGLDSIVAANDGYIDIGFCPDPAKHADLSTLSSAPACDDAVFLRATAKSIGTIELVAVSTAGGKPASKPEVVTVGAKALIEVFIYTTAYPQDLTIATDANIIVHVDGAERIDWSASTETRYLGHFGAFNLRKGIVPSACLDAVKQSFQGTLSNVEVSANSKAIPLGDLVAGGALEKGTWEPGKSWIDFEVDACDEQYLLVVLTAP